MRLRTILSTKNVQNGRVIVPAVVVLNTAYFLDLEIFLSKIKNLLLRWVISHKFIHRNCGQLHGRFPAIDGRNYFVEIDSVCAAFLRTEKYPLRIKTLTRQRPSCAHFYPQKVCRTLLAANRATRYIAQLPCDVVFYLFRSSFCSLFFKPQAGRSGCC